MLGALRGAMFYGLMIGGGMAFLGNAFLGVIMLVGSYVWGSWVLRPADQDNLAALLFFLFVLSMIGLFFMALVE